MKLACSHCGAALDTTTEVHEFTCETCGATTQREDGQVVSPEIADELKPEPAVKPSSSLCADRHGARQRGGSRRSKRLLMVPVVVGVVAMILVCGGLVATSRTVSSVEDDASGLGSTQFVPTSALRELTMAQRREDVLAKFPGAEDFGPHGLQLHMMGGPLETVVLRWHQPDPNQVAGFVFRVRHGATATEACTKLRKMLPSQWVGDVYEFGGFLLNCNYSTIDVSTRRGWYLGLAPEWRKQCQALWTVVSAAVFGGPGIPEEEARRLLALGYPFSDLAKLPWSVDVEAAPEAVHAIFPGAARRVWEGVMVQVPLAHPRFRMAELFWEVRQGTKLQRVVFQPVGDPKAFAQQAVIAACLEKGMKAKARVVESRYQVVGRDTYRIDAGGVSAHVDTYEVNVSITRHSPASQKKMEALVQALDGCAR